MEDKKLNLDPGFRFNPFESELINFYLKPKVMGDMLSCSVIEERQLYGANPWQVFDPQNHPWILSEVSCGKFEKISYAFVNLTKKAAANSSNKQKSHVGGREKYIRKVGCGTWDGQTKRTEIRDCDNNLIGERTMLVFEINEVCDKEDLSWVGHWRMHEYHLCGVNKDIPNLSNTVLCKIILDHSKKPAIKLLPNNAPEKNKTKKTNTKKLDAIVWSSSSTNSAVVDTLEGISKGCGDFTTICHNDGLVSGPKGEEERCCDDDDLDDWINNLFVTEFEFPSYPEHEDEQLGKRKLQPETSYVPEDTSVFLVSLLFGLGPMFGGNLRVAFALAFRFQHTLLTGLAFGIATILGAWRPLQLLPSEKNKNKAKISEYDESVCEKCGSGEKAAELLLCDKCDKGFHLFCLRPILPSVPKGSWLCPNCSVQIQTKPKSISLTQTKIVDFFRIQRCSQSTEKLSQDCKKRKRPTSLCTSNKKRRLLPFSPSEDSSTRFKQMNSLAAALTATGADYSNELTYMPGLAPRSANCPTLEREGMQLNGRFETQTKICLSISNHHPEHWQPSWSGTVHC